MAAAPSLGGDREARNLVIRALRGNPRVAAARGRLDHADALRDGVAGFLDPRLTARAGHSDWGRTVPGATRTAGLTPNSTMVALGVEKAARPGAYLSLGAAERYLTEPGNEIDELYQSFAGAQVWIPLLKDRAFASWRATELSAAATSQAASNDLLNVMQEVRRDVETTYIAVLLSLAEQDVVLRALDRAERLLGEAQELVRLKVIPEYQLFTARLDVELYHEEREAARERSRALLIRLGEHLGLVDAALVTADAGTIVAWATDLDDPPEIPLAEACRRRGFYLSLLGVRDAARAESGRLREDLKPDIALTLAATWQGEDPDDFVGGDEWVSEQNFGSEVALVWTQPLGQRAERAMLAANEALIASLDGQLEQSRLLIAAELGVARNALASAQARFKTVNSAVIQAEKALAAEEERFRLGEARSRHVLDAQKDLTGAARRRNAAAEGMLRSRTDLLYSGGYDPQEMRTMTQTDEDPAP